MISSLAACAGSPPPPNCFCPIAVHPDDTARAWLGRLNPPDDVNQYLHKIGVQQKDIERACGQ